MSEIASLASLESELQNLVISRNMECAIFACRNLELKYTEEGLDVEKLEFYCIYFGISIVLDLDGARHLWRRLPQHMKCEGTELHTLWTISQQLWQRNITTAFEIIIRYNWSQLVRPIVEEIIISVRKHQILLISKSYSSISLEHLSQALMLSREDTCKELSRLDWELQDSDFVLVKPLREDQHSGNTIADDTKMLAQLSEYVCHLEKRSLKVDITGKSSSSDLK